MDRPHRVLIAGGGVAALEAALALRALAGDRVELELLSPSDILTYRPLATLEPFRHGAARRFPIGDVAARAGARWRRGRLVAIDSWARTARTDGCADVAYDSLLLAMGAKPQAAVPGAITFVNPPASPTSSGCWRTCATARRARSPTWCRRAPPGRCRPTSWR